MQKAQNSTADINRHASGGVLPTARLGREGPQVTRLGYGSMGLVSLCYDLSNIEKNYLR
jgi:hypothetical protein